MAIRCIASATGPASLTLYGRTYSLAAGAVLDLPDSDALAASGNGWIAIGGGPHLPIQVGATATRPTRHPAGITLPVGTLFLDTTVGGVIVFDGSQWRSPISGSVV